jgi:D-xylose reductase
VYRYVKENHPEFLAKVREHGARYIRTLPAKDDPSSPIGRSYQNTWNVSSKQELEEKLAKVPGCTWEWIGEDVRVTTEAVPAIRMVADHAQNFIFQHTFANSIVAAYLGWQDTRNDRHEALRFGNMEKMPEDVLEQTAAFMESHRIMYNWKKGDIMALNNQLVMHSRNPFTGKRRVLASIWGPPLKAVSQAPPENGKAIGLRPDFFLDPLTPADPLVFGFWKVAADKAAEICYQAIAAGYRRLDCACDYANEKEVGEGIARAIKEGLCQREDLFVSSKLWNTYHSPEHVPLALNCTLVDLQLTYLDEYLIHFPISTEFVPFKEKYPPEWTNLDGKMILVANDMGATWKAMEALVDQNLCKTIGVCNFSTQLLRQLVSTCRIRPTTLQIEVHPHNSQEKIIRVARELGMRVTAFSILGASSYLEMGMATKDQMLLEDSIVQAIAKTKSKSPAQVLIRWALQRNTLPLCKTSTPSRMMENRNVLDFYLTGADMKALNSLNKNRRYNDPGVFCELAFGTSCPIYE